MRRVARWLVLPRSAPLNFRGLSLALSLPPTTTAKLFACLLRCVCLHLNRSVWRFPFVEIIMFLPCLSVCLLLCLRPSFVCLSVSASACLTFSLCLYLSVSTSVSFCLCLSVSLFCPCMSVSVSLSLSLSLSLFLSVSLSQFLSLFLSLSLSLSLSACLTCPSA